MISVEECLEKTEEVLKKYKFFDNFEKCSIITAYASGSIFEGFGNENSDIDIFVIVDKLPEENMFEDFNEKNPNSMFFNKNNYIIITFRVEGLAFDVEFHTKKNIEDYITNVNENTKEIRSYTNIEYDVLHRIKYGVSLYNRERFEAMRKGIKYNNFNSIIPNCYSDYTSGDLLDVKGAFYNKDYATAYYMSSNLLFQTINAYLALHGETNPKMKWIFKKIERYEKENIEKDIDLKLILDKNYKSIDIYNNDSLIRAIQDNLSSFQKLNTYIQRKR